MRVLLLLLCSQWMIAQCPPSGMPLPGNSCQQAPFVNQGLDGYCGTLSAINQVKVFPGCDGFIFNNDAWLRFYAASGSISIEVTPVNCLTGSGTINPGMQGAIYRSCSPAIPMDVQCLCTDNPFTLSSNNFEIGESYWLALDGCQGNVCDYSIKVLQGNTAMPATNISICKDSCIAICDSVFCTAGLHIAMCPDSAGFISPYFYFINQINPIASISGGSAITCEEPILTLTAQSNIGNIAWLNDLGKIIGTGPQLSVADAGFYTLKITDGSCTNTETKWVKNNKQIPTVKATGGQIDPVTGSIQLHANSIYTGLIYHWSGPNGFTSSLKNPVVSIPGLYMLTVTNPVTGCSNSVEVIVTI